MSAETVTAALFNVSGRRAVVTGAASGLGLAIAEVLADCGARVTLAGVDGERAAAEAARLAARGGGGDEAAACGADRRHCPDGGPARRSDGLLRLRGE